MDKRSGLLFGDFEDHVDFVARENSCESEALANIISAELSTWNSLPNFREPGLHPSQIAGACPRAAVLKHMTAGDASGRENFNPQVLRLFGTGTALHKWYQERYLGKAGVLFGEWMCSRCRSVVKGYMPKEPCSCQQQLDFVPDYCKRNCGASAGFGEWRDPKKVQVRGGCVWCGQNNERAWGQWVYLEIHIRDEELDIEGSTDGIVNIDGSLWVLEIKTINARGFVNLTSPYKKHKAQGFVYLGVLRKQYPALKGIRFLYVAKDGMKDVTIKGRVTEREFVCTWDAEAEIVWQEVLNIAGSIKDHTLPRPQQSCLPITKLSILKKECSQWAVCRKAASGVEGWADVEKMQKEKRG